MSRGAPRRNALVGLLYLFLTWLALNTLLSLL
jgi:hypothetical protein